MLCIRHIWVSHSCLPPYPSKLFWSAFGLHKLFLLSQTVWPNTMLDHTRYILFIIYYICIYYFIIFLMFGKVIFSEVWFSNAMHCYDSRVRTYGCSIIFSVFQQFSNNWPCIHSIAFSVSLFCFTDRSKKTCSYNLAVHKATASEKWI